MKQSWKYHKIMSVYKRDEKTHQFFIGDYSTPEIEYLKDNRWVFTEKVDGTNIRIKWDGKEAIYCGRSDDAQIPVPLIHKLDELFKSYEARERLAHVFNTPDGEAEVYLYGEGYGNKIQKEGENYIKDGVSFVLFDVFINGYWLERDNVEIVAKALAIDIVPIVGKGTLDEAIEMTKKGFKSQWGDFTAEGIVARPQVEILTSKGERIITKVKHKDFI